MDPLLQQLLIMGAIGSYRQDETVARQAIINHQGASQLAILSFIRDATEFSIPEAYATSALALSYLPGQAAGMNLSSVTPPIALQVKPAA
jgi:hypothetical protein